MIAPKFIPNTADGLHCVQASVGMILDYFLPNKKFSMNDLEKITGYVEGKYTQETSELLSYPDLGLDGFVMADFDYREYAERGIDYMTEVWGKETAEWELAHMDNIELDRAKAMRVFEKKLFNKKIPTREDVIELLGRGSLVMLFVNSRRLRGKEGFSGHRVLVYEANKQGVTMHDPGNPPLRSHKVSWNDLEPAWADPGDSHKFLVAVGKK